MNQKRGGAAGWRANEASTWFTPGMASAFAMATAAGPDWTWGPKATVAVPRWNVAAEDAAARRSDFKAARIWLRMMACSNKAAREFPTPERRRMESESGEVRATSKELESFSATSSMASAAAAGFGGVFGTGRIWGAAGVWVAEMLPAGMEEAGGLGGAITAEATAGGRLEAQAESATAKMAEARKGTRAPCGDRWFFVSARRVVTRLAMDCPFGRRAAG